MDEGEKLIKEAEYIIDNYFEDDRILHIRDAMNRVYKYYKSVIKEATFSDKRLIKVFSLERKLEKEYLPLNTTPDFDSTRQVNLPETIQNEHDCFSVASYVVHKTRMRLNEWDDVLNDPLEKKCINSSGYVDKICEDNKINCTTFQLNMDLKPGLFHCFNIVTIYMENGDAKDYIVDCTYRQFFTLADSFPERIGMPLNSGINMGRYMIMDERRKQIAEELLINGFIECTPENLKAYLDGFIVSGRNALYYETLGKITISKEDFVPSYTYEEYLQAIVNNIPLPEYGNGRQFGISQQNIQYDTLTDEHYLGTEYNINL